MSSRIEIFKPDVINNQKINSFINLSKTPDSLVEKKPLSEILAHEGCENFVTYLEWLGLNKDPNLVVLSSMHHYYYDAEEMKEVKTIVNLKELNQITKISSVLHSIFHILQPNSKYIGCFVDNKKQNGYAIRHTSPDHYSKKNTENIENGIVSRIPFLNMLYSMLDFRTNKYMSRTNVSLLLEDHGFKVMDMTELNGLTYFCAKRLNTFNSSKTLAAS